MVLAHHKKDDNGQVHEQSLAEHLLKSAEIAYEIAQPIGIGKLMQVLLYLHDIGKADSVFQKYIRGLSKKRVNHSSAGARFFTETVRDIGEKNQWLNRWWFHRFVEICQYVILAHHGLFDIINYESNYQIGKRLSYDDNTEYNYSRDVLGFTTEFDQLLINAGEDTLNGLLEKAAHEFETITSKILNLAKKMPEEALIQDAKKRAQQNEAFYLSCLMRLMLSILKEADIYDSSNHFRAVTFPRLNNVVTQSFWEDKMSLIETVYDAYKSVPKVSELNNLRNKLSDQAKDFAEKHDTGVYKLDLPTGAGKTKASIRYSLANINSHNKQRFFYITAFLSVLEQNAAEVKDILGPNDVLEHHSNAVVECTAETDDYAEDMKDYEEVRYLVDSWESPIILTTMVQFSNTLYKGGASNIRRFCKLIKAAIVVDEIQSLPLKSIYCFNLMFNFLSNIMDCNIVHSTATPPIFDLPKLQFPIRYGDSDGNNSTICEAKLTGQDCFKRVNFINLTGVNAENRLDTKQLMEHINQTMNTYQSCLVVVNTKKAALTLYKELSDAVNSNMVFYLSTNLCPKHRLAKIKQLKHMLVQNRAAGVIAKKIICVSTQLIEAGVDLDFDVVYRSLAGVDSIIQSAGRCNREGKLKAAGYPALGNVYIFRYFEEKLVRLKSIQDTIDASAEAIRALKMSDDESPINIKDLQDYYFKKYYVEHMDQMNYCLPNKNTIVDTLSLNSNQRTEYRNKNNGSPYIHTLAQAFDTAAKSFNLIDEDTVGLIVQYENKELMDRLYHAIDTNEYDSLKKTLRSLQPYTVNMYHNQIKEGYIRKEMDGKILILEDGCYNKDIGVTMDILPDYIS